MKVDYSKQEMVAQWKRRTWLEPLRTDCIISRSDGINLDEYAEIEMRKWYLKLLHEAPLEMLSVSDLTLTSTVKRSSAGQIYVDLPDGVIRLVRVRLSGWERDAEIVTDSSSRLALRQSNPFSRGGVSMPVAVVSGKRLELFSAESSRVVPGLECLWAIVDPGPDTYRFDELAWGWNP